MSIKKERKDNLPMQQRLDLLIFRREIDQDEVE